MNNKTETNGVGLGGLLLLCFIVLKLIGKIDWSWWWVLSPIWIPLGVVICVACLLLLARVIGENKND